MNEARGSTGSVQKAITKPEKTPVILYPLMELDGLDEVQVNEIVLKIVRKPGKK